MANLYDNFRVVDKIRNFSAVLWRMVSDIAWFIFVIFYIAITFSNIFYAADIYAFDEPPDPKTNKNFFYYFYKTFEVIHSSYSHPAPWDPELRLVTNLLFALLLLLYALIVANLLIAMAGKTFDDYQNDCASYDTQERLNMVIEI